MPAPTLLAAWLAFAPPAADSARLDLDAEGLDAAAVEAGLRARVGDAVDGWTVAVRRQSDGRYRVVLRGPRGASARRTLELVGPSDADRSRELAASLALLLDEADEGDEANEASGRGDSGSGKPSSAVVGLLAVDTKLELGPPRDPDLGLGLGLTGGAWLVRDHLQPRARIGWQHGWTGALTVHEVEAGLGLAAGAGLGPWWIGGLALPSVKWIRAEQVRRASAWQGGGELSVLVQHRRRWWVVGLRTGVDLSFPAARVPGTDAVIRWGHVRWLAAIELGFGFPG